MSKMVDIKPKERMSKIGELWKAQTQEQKDVYTAIAEEKTREKIQNSK